MESWLKDLFFPLSNCLIYIVVILWASLIAQMAKNPSTTQENWFDSWISKIPWRRAWQPTPVFLPEESHGQRSLAGYRLWGRKESDMTQKIHKKNYFI